MTGASIDPMAGEGVVINRACGFAACMSPSRVGHTIHSEYCFKSDKQLLASSQMPKKYKLMNWEVRIRLEKKALGRC